MRWTLVLQFSHSLNPKIDCQELNIMNIRYNISGINILNRNPTDYVGTTVWIV